MIKIILCKTFSDFLLKNTLLCYFQSKVIIIVYPADFDHRWKTVEELLYLHISFEASLRSHTCIVVNNVEMDVIIL